MLYLPITNKSNYSYYVTYLLDTVFICRVIRFVVTITFEQVRRLAQLIL